MKTTFTVHSVVEEPVAVIAQLNGRDVPARVPALVVELVNECHGHTHRLVPQSDAEMLEARALFTPGATIVATFAKE